MQNVSLWIVIVEKRYQFIFLKLNPNYLHWCYAKSESLLTSCKFSNTEPIVKVRTNLWSCANRKIYGFEATNISRDAKSLILWVATLIDWWQYQRIDINSWLSIWHRCINNEYTIVRMPALRWCLLWSEKTIWGSDSSKTLKIKQK